MTAQIHNINDSSTYMCPIKPFVDTFRQTSTIGVTFELTGRKSREQKWKITLVEIGSVMDC